MRIITHRNNCSVSVFCLACGIMTQMNDPVHEVYDDEGEPLSYLCYGCIQYSDSTLKAALLTRIDELRADADALEALADGEIVRETSDFSGKDIAFLHALDALDPHEDDEVDRKEDDEDYPF